MLPGHRSQLQRRERTWADIAQEASKYEEVNDGALSSRLHSPLHIAAARADAQMVDCLLDAGVRSNPFSCPT